MSQTGIKPYVTQPPAVTGTGWVRTELTAIAGIGISIAALLLMFLVPVHGSALAGALLMACVPAGAAVMCWVDSGEGIVQAGLTLVLSLAITGITGAAMIWLRAWHPYVLLAFPSACILSGVMRLRNASEGMWRGTLAMRRDLWLQLVLLCLGLASWGYGLSKVQRQEIGTYGLLASANVWFVLGFALLLAGALLEMNRPEPRMWLLGVYLASVIVAIYATVPILFGVPEYAWVYKHIGIIQALGKYGRVTDPSNIYEQWPVLFAAVASVSGVSHMGPISFAAWAPLAFELANALLVLGIFRLLGADRRVTWLALFMYEGLVAWVGQDYLSPQAFGYLLWLGMAAVLIRWMRAAPPAPTQRKPVTWARARLLKGLPTPRPSSPSQIAIAMTFITVIYFAIVAAHQLTPYLALAAVGPLVVLGLLRRGWLVLLLMIAVCGAYLVSRYSLIVSQFGGLFGGGNALENASGMQAAFHQGGEAATAEVVRALAIGMWLAALGAIVLQWRTLGRVATPAVLAFSPFLIVLVQNYGGEAIYRIFLFSAPWCALLIADALSRLRLVLWRPVTAFLCFVILAAGLQGSYGAMAVDAFTPAELAASLWLYDHAPHGSALVYAADNLPGLETADFYDYDLEIIPADPQFPGYDLTEANLPEVQAWMTHIGYRPVYVVVSRSMADYYDYYGGPFGYPQLVNAVRTRPGWSVVYHNTDATIYRVRLPLPVHR